MAIYYFSLWARNNLSLRLVTLQKSYSQLIAKFGFAFNIFKCILFLCAQMFSSEATKEVI